MILPRASDAALTKGRDAQPRSFLVDPTTRRLALNPKTCPYPGPIWGNHIWSIKTVIPAASAVSPPCMVPKVYIKIHPTASIAQETRRNRLLFEIRHVFLVKIILQGMLPYSTLFSYICEVCRMKTPLYLTGHAYILLKQAII